MYGLRSKLVCLLVQASVFLQYYDNIYKYFTNDNCAYNIKKCETTYMFFYLLSQVKSFISKISYKKCYYK